VQPLLREGLRLQTSDLSQKRYIPSAMRISTQDLRELDELMRAARMRVLHIISLVFLVALVVSLAIVTRAKISLRELPSIVIWFAGCGIIVLLARLWYGSRVRATQQLLATVERGSPTIKIVEVTGFTWNI